MNKIILLGRLVKDVEMKYFDNDRKMGKFTLAVNRKFVKAGEERKADFINCQVWGKTAEFVSNYFAKGSQILVEGRLQIDAIEGDDGKRIYFTNVVVESCEFAGSKGDSQGQTQTGKKDEFVPVDGDDDDLPF